MTAFKETLTSNGFIVENTKRFFIMAEIVDRSLISKFNGSDNFAVNLCLNIQEELMTAFQKTWTPICILVKNTETFLALAKILLESLMSEFN